MSLFHPDLGVDAYTLIRRGVSAWGAVKPVAVEAIDQDRHLPPSGFDAFHPDVVSPGAVLHGRGDPLSLGADRLALAQAQPGSAGVSTARRRGQYSRAADKALLVLAYLRKRETFAELAAGFGIGTPHRLAVCDRDGGTAGGPVPKAAPRWRRPDRQARRIWCLMGR
jgi:hypothetical protein